MNAVIIGSGGREHTLGWKVAQSNKIDKVFFIPGNAGTLSVGENINIDINNFDEIKNFIVEKNIKLIVVGPEQPLVKGLSNYLRKELPEDSIIVGPSKEGAQLEGSKIFAKKFMQRHNIPTAKFGTFNKNQVDEAIDFLKTFEPPYVLKADGLAAGKGVLIIDNFDDATNALKEMFSGKFGTASENVVIEQFLKGIELSVFILTDGKKYIILPTSKDYKRIGDGDTGLNTGGMGAVSPVPFATPDFLQKIEKKIIRPTIEGLNAENIDYKGFLYFGLMKVGDEPYVIEYNVRMGDPETQVVIPRIKSDLVSLFEDMHNGTLDSKKLEITQETAVTVVIASGGYPEKYEKNKKIEGLDKVKDCKIFHAGTKYIENSIYTNGGRVLAVTCFGKNIEDARKNVYNSIKLIKFDRNYYRQDIGLDLIK